MLLSQFNRISLAHLPTPIEPLLRLSKHLGGPNIWIKRDDCTGLAGGGNKTRKLEFLMGDALQQKADVIITQGAVQSNHVRQTAAASCKLGLPCYGLLEDRVQSPLDNANQNGNVLLDKIFNTQLIRFANGTDMHHEMEKLANDLVASGQYRKPYIIPGGGSNPIGALGYVNAALEMVSQLNQMSLPVKQIIHGTGSTGTQGGLAAGLSALNANVSLLGISVRTHREEQEKNVRALAEKTLVFMSCEHAIEKLDIVANSDYVGDGYGIPSTGALEAIELLARTEGILLDPVYSGKAMAGLIGLVRNGAFTQSDNILFIHTGGAQALPGYTHCFN